MRCCKAAHADFDHILIIIKAENIGNTKKMECKKIEETSQKYIEARKGILST